MSAIASRTSLYDEITANIIAEFEADRGLSLRALAWVAEQPDRAALRSAGHDVRPHSRNGIALGATVETAPLALVIGISQILIWAGIVYGGNTPDQLAFALKRYFPRRQSWGEVIDTGVYTVIFAIALGILTEISRNVRANRTKLEKATDAGDHAVQ
jgi:hypothetical protein